MPGFLKGLKMKSIKKGNFSRYLGYALGEIILVVIGILIALSIKTCQEEKNEQAQLDGILSTLRNDLVSDTIAINKAIQYYKSRDEISKKIITDQFGVTEYKNCMLCINMLTFYYPLELNEKGYNQLENFYEGSRQKDSLALTISEFYKNNTPLVDKIGIQIETSALETTVHWRDNYPWFSKIIGGNLDSGFFEYMETSDYKNRVAYFRTMAIISFPQILEQYKLQARELLEALN